MLPEMLAFDKKDCQDVYDKLVQMKKRPDAHQVLIDMQTQAGISEDQAVVNLQQCIEAVAECESVRSMMGEDAMGIVNALLAELAKREDRMLFLHKISFALENEQIDVDLDPQEWESQFLAYYEQNKDAKTPQELEAEIRAKVRKFHIPANQLRDMAEEMKLKNATLVLPSLTGQDDYFVKHIMTMKLYVDHAGELSMLEAANIACCSADAMATADKLGRGLISRERAKKLMYVLGVAVVVIGAAIALYYTGAIAEIAAKIPLIEEIAVPVPGIFEEIATNLTTTSGAGEMLQNSLIPLKQKKLQGGLISLAGALFMTLSLKIGDLVGRFQLGRICDSEMAQKGLLELADDGWRQEEEMPLYNWEAAPQTQQKQQQSQQWAMYLG